MRGIKDTVLNAMLATVTIVATIAGVRYFLPGAERDFNEKQLAAAELVDNWETYSAAGKRIGSQSPKVTIVAFSDFTCIHCRALALILQELQTRYGDEVLVVYRHYPLDALAATAAHVRSRKQDTGESSEDECEIPWA